MEAQALVPLLVTLALAVLIFLAIFFPRTRSRRQSRPVPNPKPHTTEVSDPAVARLMLIDHADAFSNRPMVITHFANGFRHTHSINSVPYGSTWRALRGNLTADIFHPTRLGLLAPLQREAVQALVAGLSSRGTGQVVVRDSLHSAVFAMTVRLCLGDGVDERVVRALKCEVLQFVYSFVKDNALAEGSRFTRLLHWRRWRRYAGRYSRLSKLILPAIFARQQSWGSSNSNSNSGSDIRCYVDSLLDLRIPDNDDDAKTSRGSKRPLTDGEMVRLVFEFLGANTESTVSCVEWTLAHLVTHPAVQKKLHHEITSSPQGKGGVLVSEERLGGLPYLRAVILETLRLHPPVPLIVREVTAHDAAINCGTLAPADGTPVQVIINVGDVGRNEKAWTDPNEFRPERFLAGGEAEGMGPLPGPKDIRMLPFGAGRRYCPGIELGMLNVGYFLAALVREFDWTLPLHGHSIDMSEFRGFFMYMKTPLQAHITPRTSAA